VTDEPAAVWITVLVSYIEIAHQSIGDLAPSTKGLPAW
jgi:hypothetical protein